MELSKKYNWGAVYIFGSLIKRGKFSNKSDIDIAVKGLDKFDYFSFVGEISALLNRSVDVINMEDCHFAESIVSKGVRWSMKRKSPSL